MVNKLKCKLGFHKYHIREMIGEQEIDDDRMILFRKCINCGCCSYGSIKHADTSKGKKYITWFDRFK